MNDSMNTAAGIACKPSGGFPGSRSGRTTPTLEVATRQKKRQPARSSVVRSTSPARTPAGKATSKPAAPHRIDVHHHIMPPRYLVEPGTERVAKQAVVSLWQQVLAWTPDKSIEQMDANGVATSILSLSAPGVWFGDVAQGRRIARDCNEYAARLAADYPGRFGSFASIPLPDVEGSLHEIEYSLDVLKADGIVLMTSFDDKWPGEAAFSPVFEELNRRKAVVYFHPTVAPCCMNLIPDVSDSTIEFLFDTVRAVTSLLYSGTFSRFPDIRYIFSHAGSAVPLLSARICRVAAANPKVARRLPNGAYYELKKLYYELAQTRGSESLTPLTELVGAKSIMLGSDFPWTGARIADTIEAVAKFGFSASEIADIERENALRLFPRLSGES